MREIKFRAWDQDHQKMAMDVHKEYDTIAGVRFSDGEEPGENCFDSYLTRDGYPDKSRKRYVVMQYTGLHDKNGKEIFEGDILRHPKVGDIGPVEWDDDFAGFHWLHPKMYNGPMDECEVIGNVFENPELVDGD